jgi:hypothetical protein
MLDLSRLVGFATLAAALAASFAAHAQSSCSSDGQPRPAALMERFISADCESCWSDAQTPRAGRNEIALDWIVPGAKGDDAPLSAAASRDAVSRLESLHRAMRERSEVARHAVTAASRRSRVAHGLPFNGYVGASIELKPGTGGPWNAWLALVETIPAGTEGTPVARNLVRNVLQVTWEAKPPLSKDAQTRWFESRPLSIPEGVDPKRLRVVGWIEDARGRLVGAAQSACAGS